MRRLRAMLENLIETLPNRRAPLLRKELSLLASSSARMFAEIEDQALAGICDRGRYGFVLGRVTRGGGAVVLLSFM